LDLINPKMSRPERHNTNIPRSSEVYKRDDHAELLKLLKNKLEVEEKLKNEERQDRIEFLTILLKSYELREARLRELLAKENQ